MDREWHGRSREPEFWETLAERKPALGALCKGVKGMSMSESDGASCEGGGWLSTRLRALRAFSFPVSVLPVFVATAAVYPHSQWSWDVLAASVLGVMLLHAMGNLLNDYFDFSAGVDRKLDGDEGRPGRILVRGELLPKDVLAEAGICLLVLTPIAGYLLWKCGPGLLWFGVAALAALYAYTGPPFALKYRAMGEPVIFFVFGPLLMLGAAYAQTARWEWSALIASIPVGLATTAILVGNNLRDTEEDATAGITTLTSLAGQRLARTVYVTLVVASTLVVSIMGIFGLGPRSFIMAPFLLVLIYGSLSCVWRGKRIPDIDVQTARFETVLLVFLITLLVWNGGLIGVE